MMSKPTKTAGTPKNEPQVTSYNEFVRRFYPDNEKAQSAKADSSQKTQVDVKCLFSDF